MGRWQSWITRDDDYYRRRAEQRITLAEWGAGALILVLLYALMLGGLNTCAWVSTHAPWLAGR